ncbi:MAG: hypothetical protein Q7T51_02095 [Candidatus Moranbacteria bacterium]|nr:hypothetical protein [Candidatus Moranbacteria bacterium]
MSLDGFRKNSENQVDNRLKNLFLQGNPEMKDLPEPEEAHEKLISEHSADVLAHWQAPEFEVYEQDQKWMTYIGLVLVAIIGYAIYDNSLIMAITFVLIGVVGYIYIEKAPRTLDFMVTHDGVVAGSEIFEYENIKSFWIFYEPEGQKVISLHMNGGMLPYIHIPIHDQDPVKIREALLINLHEMKQSHNFVDTLERFLRI